MSSKEPAPTCPGCGSNSLYISAKGIPGGGGYAPDLLPGLHPWYRSGRLRAVVCADCGLYRQFVEEPARDAVRHSAKWRRL